MHFSKVLPSVFTDVFAQKCLYWQNTFVAELLYLLHGKHVTSIDGTRCWNSITIFSSTAEPSIKSAGGLCHTFCEGCFTDLLEIFGFSRMCSKGSRFNPGVWALRVCLLDVARSRSQPFATVRNRPQPFVWGPYGRAYGKFCRRCHFWRFPMFRCFVSRGRRGTSWHSDVFCNVSKIVSRGRRNTFVTFSEDVLQFSWQAQHFGRVHRHFSWQAQHFRRVVLCVFCKSHWQGCVKWRQGANSVAGVAFCDMCWKLTEASHETSILRLQILEVPKKTRRKTLILKLQRCENWRKSRTKCSFWCSHVSRLESLVFPWLRRVYGGSCKTCPFVMLPTVKIGRKSRTKCWFFLHPRVCLESLVFLWRRRVYGGSRKTSPFRMFPRRLSCRFGWQAWQFLTFQPVW